MNREAAVETREDNFKTALDADFLQFLYPLADELGFDPLCSIEAERHFLGLQNRNWVRGEANENLERGIRASFTSLTSPPEWIQGAEWPFEEGEPMIFIGQIETPPNLLVGDRGFYLFVGRKTGNTQVVSQWV